MHEFAVQWQLYGMRCSGNHYLKSPRRPVSCNQAVKIQDFILGGGGGAIKCRPRRGTSSLFFINVKSVRPYLNKFAVVSRKGKKTVF